MWETSNTPTSRRTARCSDLIPAYWTGISQPANGTSLAPAAAWRSCSGVRRSEVSAGVDTHRRLQLRAAPLCPVRWGDLHRPVEDARDHRERGLRRPVEIEQSLVQEGRIGPRIATGPSGGHREVLQGEVQRAREPALGGEHVQVEGRGLSLKGVCPAL